MHEPSPGQPVVDLVWDQGYDASALLRELVLLRTGTDPGPLHHRCASCGSITHGQPYYDGFGWVSIARAGGLVVVAFSADAPIGVDVAVTDETAPGWTRYEALAKARGTGIVTEHDPSAPDVWIEDVPVPPGFTAALAVLSLNQPPAVRAAPRRRATS